MQSGIRNQDWHRILDAGCKLAVDQARNGDDLTATAAMWALLREAAQVSMQAYNAPPRQGYPGKSAMPDAPDEITTWQIMSAYLRGEVQELPEEPTPPRPSAEQVTRAEIILALWHMAALRDKSNWHPLRKAVYLKACGAPDRKIRALTGYSRQYIHRAKNTAMQDMLDFVREAG